MKIMSENIEDFLKPGDCLVKPVGRGDNYIDFLLSQVLAIHGCIIRDLWLEGDGAILIIYKYKDGVRIGGERICLKKIPDGRKIETREERLIAMHGLDLIVRYYDAEDGSLCRPMWHTAFSGLYKIRGYNQSTVTVLENSTAE